MMRVIMVVKIRKRMIRERVIVRRVRVRVMVKWRV